MKESHAEAGYHRGHGATGSHCSICRHYISGDPPHCRIVVDPIRPDDGCNRFQPRLRLKK